MLYLNSSYYLTYLKQINKETEIAEYILKKSMKNKELLKLLSLEKSLVYFTTSLKSNELVMEKTLRGKIIKLYEEDEDILEDAITENKQAIEMAKIYSDILTWNNGRICINNIKQPKWSNEISNINNNSTCSTNNGIKFLGNERKHTFPKQPIWISNNDTNLSSINTNRNMVAKKKRYVRLKHKKEIQV